MWRPADLLSEQAGCDEFFSGLHHLLPHLEGASLFIEKCQSLLLGNGASMFVGQSQQMRKCDFGHHSVSIFFVRHEFSPQESIKNIDSMPVIRSTR